MWKYPTYKFKTQENMIEFLAKMITHDKWKTTEEQIDTKNW